MKNIILVLLFNIKVTFLGFGGGNALFPIMRKEAVERHKWLTETEFDNLVVSANMIPGPSVVEGLSFISMKVLGKFMGGLISLIGMFPHILFAVVLYVVSQEFIPEKYLFVINASIIPVIMGLLISFSFRFIKSSYKNLGLPFMLALIIFTMAFSLFVPAPYNIPAIIMVAITLTVLIIGMIKNRRQK